MVSLHDHIPDQWTSCYLHVEVNGIIKDSVHTSGNIHSLALETLERMGQNLLAGPEYKINVELFFRLPNGEYLTSNGGENFSLLSKKGFTEYLATTRKPYPCIDEQGEFTLKRSAPSEALLEGIQPYGCILI